MKYALIVILAAVFSGNELTKIARVNELKRDAKEAYMNGDYASAIEKYKNLVDSFDVAEEEVLLNLSNSFYESNDTASAVSYYQKLINSPRPDLRSLAHQQLGVVEAQRKQYEQALTSFKESLKADPSNEDSRYNYELLKKLIKEQENKKQQNQDQQNKDQQNKDQQNQDKKDQENQENKDQGDKENQDQNDQQKQDQKENEKENEQKQEEQPDPSTQQKLKEMNISEEKARMILEAMKNNEIQYIQQNKRKATKPKKSNKPDW